MSKQNEYTRSAKGRACQVRIAGICNYNPETVVLAHVNGAGMGKKAESIHGAYCCSACHDMVDGRVPLIGYTRDLIKLWHLEGVIRTQQIMIEEGIIKL